MNSCRRLLAGTLLTALVALPGIVGVLKGGAALNVAYAPYLFDSEKEAERLANSELFTPILDELATHSSVRIFGVDGSRSPRVAKHWSVTDHIFETGPWYG